MKRLLMAAKLLLFLFVGHIAFGQEKVTGKVTDEQGNALSGVNVIQLNTSNGTLTDDNGAFSLQLKAGSSRTLEFSFVGYRSIQQVYNGQPLTITLQQQNSDLEDVVVIGYGTVRKAQLTAAVSSVKGSDMAKTQAIDVGNALQGMASGVNVTAPTGAPGSEAVVRIRGIGTLNNSNPLYIVDGIPINGGLTTISPSDIESMEVLKDASAASIYGARAGNGVILVTTKSGRAGKNQITFDASVGLSRAVNLPKMVSTSQYIQLQNEAFANDGNANRNNDDAASLPNTDWQDAVFQNGITQRYSIGFAGGSEKTKYYISANTIDQKGIIINSGFKRYGIRTNVSSEVKPWLKIGENLSLTYDIRQNIGASGDGARPGSLPGVVRYALIRPNAIPVYDPVTGLLTDLPPASLYDNANLYGDGKNPVAIAQYRNSSEYRYRALGNVFAEAKIINGLKLRSDLGVDFVINEQQSYAGQIPGDRTILTSLNKSVNKYRNRNNVINWTNTLNYTREWGEHSLNLTAGTEYVTWATDYLSASRNGYDDRSDITRSLQYLQYGTGQQFGSGNLDRWSLMSYFGRAIYSYKDKYLATVSLRSDGSSRFSRDNRTGYYPAFSLGWNISKESFMENVNWIDDLKIRGSWGSLGNQDIGQYYPFATIYSTANNVLNVISKGNPDVQWETTKMTNIGFDAGIFNRKLRLSVDYYVRNTEDILIQLPVSYTNGDAAPPYVNGAKMRNNGLDVTMNYSESKGDWSWDATGNITTIKNEVKSLYLGNEQFISTGNATILLREGQPVSSFYGYRTAGIFQNQGDVDNYVNKDGDLIQPNAKPGDIRFADLNADGILDDKDREIIGHGLPKFTYSLNGNVRFKQFDLNLFFFGVSGNDVYNEVDNIISSFDSRGFNSTERYFDEHWNGEGTSNTTPRATYLDGNNNRRTSDRYIQNGSYLRLKNAVIGYNLPRSIRSAGISSARVFISAQNLFTITKYKGMDPELYNNDNLASYSDLAIGIDMGTYPPAKTFNIGIQVNF